MSRTVPPVGSRRRPVSDTTPSDWSPILLRRPGRSDPLSETWHPALLRRRRFTVLSLLLLFLALQFLIPSRLVIAGMGAVGRPSVAMGVALAFLWFLCAIRPHRLPRGNAPLRWVMAVFVALQFFGYVVGIDRGPTPDELSNATMWLIFIVAMAGVAMAAAEGLTDRRDVDRLLCALVWVAAAMAVVGILQYSGLVDLTRYINIPGLRQHADLLDVGARGDGGIPRVAGTANHYIEFGVVLALTLPIALHYALFAPRGRVRLWRFTAVALIGSAIPLSISRSAILTLAMTMIFLALVWSWRQRYNALAIALVMLGAFHVVTQGVLGTIQAYFLNYENDPSIQNRIGDIDYVYRLWVQRPWLGYGAGMITPERYIMLDNQFYGTLLAGGVLGLIGLVALFVVPYLLARSVRLRAADQETRHLGQALAVTIPSAFMASATFDSFAFSTFTGTLFIIIGVISAIHRIEAISVHSPLQPAAPGDKFVKSPLMFDIRRRLREGATGGALLSRR